MITVKKLNKIIPKSLIKSTSIYLGFDLLNKIISLLILPVLTKYLSPSDYGIVSIFLAVSGFMIPFVGLSSNTTLARYYHGLNKTELSKFINNILVVITTCTLIIIILIIIFSSAFSNLLDVNKIIFFLAAITASANIITTISLTLFQLQKNPIFYGILSLSKFGIDIILSLVLIIILSLTWDGRIYGILCASLLTAFYSIGYIFYKYKLKYCKIDLSVIKSIVKFGIPLIPNAVSGFIINMGDKIIITILLGLEEVGIYAIGYTFGSVINMIQTGFSRAWMPEFFSMIREDTNSVKIKFKRITIIYSLLLLISALIIGILAPYILQFMVAPEFYAADKIILWIALGYAANGVYKMFTGYLLYNNKNMTLSNITFVQACMNIVLNLVFIKWYGLIGAAYATFITFLFGSLVIIYQTNKIYPLKWREI